MPRDLRRYDEPGHTHFWTISCYRRLTFFWYDPMKVVVVDALRRLQVDLGVCVIGYVIMPEHLHVLLYPHQRGNDTPIAVSRLLHAFKQHIGFHGKERLRDYWRQHSRLWSAPLTAWALGKYPKREICHTRGYDGNINRHKTLLEKLDYCHANPVTRGLVDRPEDWPWSSYRYYQLGDRTLLPMDWDGRWPIIW